MRRLFSLLLIGVLFLTPTIAQAEDVSFDARVNTTQLPINSSGQLTLTVHGTQGAQPVELPTIDGLDTQYLGPSTQVTVINGRVSSATSFNYSLYPTKTGKVTIPALNITIDGKTYTSQPIEIQVTNAATKTSSQSDQLNEPVNLQDKIFLVLNVPKKEVYVNEKIPLKIQLYVSGIKARYSPQVEIDTAGFTMDAFGEPQRYQQTVGGVEHTVVEVNTNIYPTRPGPLKIGPAAMEVEVVYQNSGSRRSAFGDMDSFFSDDFFNGLFDNGDLRPMTVRSPDIEINVLPLPTEGQPPDFSGAVGKFDFEISANPPEVKVGDPITLKMRVSGDSNLKSVTMPSLKEDANFKVYEPQIKEENGAKILEQVVIPKTETAHEIPAISFNYFDPSSKTYQTISRGPFSITVKKLEKEEQSKVVGLTQAPPTTVEEDKLGEDIVFIKEYPGALKRAGALIYTNIFFYLAVFISLALWFTFFILYLQKARLETDVAYARKLQAPQKARRGLAEAKGFLDVGNPRAFYDTVFKILQSYLADKFHLSPGLVSFENISALITKSEIPTEVLTDLQSLFDECEMVRFASAGFDKNKMNEAYLRLQKTIDFLERHGK